MTQQTQPEEDGAPMAPPGPPPDAPAPTTGQASRVWPRASQLLALITVVVLGYGAILIISSLRSVLLMLLVSLFIAFAVEPSVQWLGRRGWRRGAATGFVFFVSFLLILGAFGSVVPLLIDQISDLLRSAPRSIGEINSLLAQVPLIDVQLDPDGDLNQELRRLSASISGEADGLLAAISGNVLGAAGSVVGLGATAIAVFFQVLTVLLVSFYMVADGPRLRATLARPLPPHRQREMLAIWEIAVAKTGGYIYSRILLAVAAAVTTAVALAIMGVPYPLPLGLWVGVTGAFIPVIGTYLGGLLAILVALVDRPITALWVLVYIAIYQQVENYLIAPRLQASTMDVHPAVAFVSVIVGATLLGAVGGLLALPAAAIIQAVASTYLHRHALIDELIEVSHELDDHLPSDAPPLMAPPDRPAQTTSAPDAAQRSTNPPSATT